MKTEHAKQDDVLPVREKARRHLMTWTKKQMAQFISNAVSDAHLEKWAKEYDKVK